MTEHLPTCTPRAHCQYNPNSTKTHKPEVTNTAKNRVKICFEFPARPLETVMLMPQCKPKWLKFDALCLLRGVSCLGNNMIDFHEKFHALQNYIRASSNHVSGSAQDLEMASCPSSLCSFLKTWTKCFGNEISLL